ncbi:MAG: T9SS type A sorting domain-containing protein [Bacteroidetes bacterium]|nr:T9SS type A sorting domain-containing protein [Bacteroidota bacterium]
MKLRIIIITIVILNSLCGVAQPVLKDIFGRNLAGENIILVDWEGYMANPAIKLTIIPPTSPFTVTITANSPRLYFNTLSKTGGNGPTKIISFSNSNPIDFYISIFPDRTGGDEKYTLTLKSSYGTQTFPIYVIDQDSANQAIDYPIILDYSQDKTAYNFFANQSHKKIVKQAADDWAFFLQNMNFDSIKADSQNTFIWNDDFSGGTWIKNAKKYNGFLLYPYGFHSATHRSGGEPSTSSFQTIKSINTNLRCSGGYEAEAHGNYNKLGWDSTITDSTWYMATNFGNVQNDLYSIAMHEMGHAFCFNPGYPLFKNYKSLGYINDSIIVAYQGGKVPIDASDHLSNGQTTDSLKYVDRISKRCAYGSEYAAVMPYGRWVISKLNLLALQAIGYHIKLTSAFKTVTILNQSLPDGTQGQNYSSAIVAEGGIPFYKYEVNAGNLPTGFSINSFTGEMSGVTNQSGIYNFTVRVTDYDFKFYDKKFTLNIHALSTISEQADTSIRNNFLIYPNPAKSQFTIKCTTSQKEEIIIYNVLGKSVFTDQLAPAESEKSISINGLPKGVYIIRLGAKYSKIFIE